MCSSHDAREEQEWTHSKSLHHFCSQWCLMQERASTSPIQPVSPAMKYGISYSPALRSASLRFHSHRTRLWNQDLRQGILCHHKPYLVGMRSVTRSQSSHTSNLSFVSHKRRTCLAESHFPMFFQHRYGIAWFYRRTHCRCHLAVGLWL